MITSKNLDDRIDDIQTNDEIGELAETFNKLLDRLHAAFKREQQFIADVAHELKTPLATLRSTIEVALQQKRESADYQKALEDALSETHRLSSTLKNVLDLAWSETPQEHKNAKSFNLSDLMDELLETAQKMAVQKKIVVSGSIAKNIMVYGFKDKLGRAILNIIDNAIKYTSQKGKIELVVKKDSISVLLIVKDTGRGISQKDIVHIFDRFYRGSSSERVFGSGLGLAIAKAIVHSHQGEIKVKSKIGQGTAFTITLPLGRIYE